MLATNNFVFLSAHAAQLPQFEAPAERCFLDDPAKLRQFAELPGETVADCHALYLGEDESFEETLRRLSCERRVGD